MNIVQLEPAYLLHSRPYRNTSLLADFFTLNYGRINGVIRGARSKKNQTTVQVFAPLLISWSRRGNSDLVSIRAIEISDVNKRLTGRSLLYGFYINELLVRLLKTDDSYIELYHRYKVLLQYFSEKNTSEENLRIFEKNLLSDLGYGLQLMHEAHSSKPVQDDQWYDVILDQGPVLLATSQAHVRHAFLGKSLLALHHHDFSCVETLKDAKRLMRKAFAELLNHKPLKSRELFYS
ncbi:MAG: DNA repair protein RecO [Gammaproteobacteria bacterium]|nr:DNA repair protein RecO [Gammaproteobacteria bacterium]